MRVPAEASRCPIIRHLSFLLLSICYQVSKESEFHTRSQKILWTSDCMCHAAVLQAYLTNQCKAWLWSIISGLLYTLVWSRTLPSMFLSMLLFAHARKYHCLWNHCSWKCFSIYYNQGALSFITVAWSMYLMIVSDQAEMMMQKRSTTNMKMVLTCHQCRVPSHPVFLTFFHFNFAITWLKMEE